MASPTLPADFRNAYPNASDTVCAAYDRMFGLPAKWYAYFAWKHETDGSVSDDLRSTISVSGETPSDPTSSVLDTVTGVFATTTRSTDVTISWSPVAGALSYVVYRGVSTAEEDYVELATVDGDTKYVDTSATVNKSYWYSVKAKSATRVSEEFAEAAQGKRTSSVTFEYDEENPNTPVEYIVPDGVTQMEVRAWGGGGNSGFFSGTSYTSGGMRPGAGGGAGSFVRVTGITVSAGEKYVLVVGKKTASAANTGNTFVYRDAAGSSEYVKATPGGNGENNDGDNDSKGGVAPTSPGSTTMGGVLEAETSVGDPGEDATVSLDGTGATGITYDGVTAGSGATGTNKTAVGPLNYGSKGRIVLVLT